MLCLRDRLLVLPLPKFWCFKCGLNQFALANPAEAVCDPASPFTTLFSISKSCKGIYHTLITEFCINTYIQKKYVEP